MGATVTGFTSGPGKTLSAVQYRDQQGNLHQVPGDIVLSTMPVKDLAAGLPQDWLSPEARETAATLPYRDFMTAGLLVDRLELKNETDHPTLNHIVPDCSI